ncbi:hypothetical protein QH494_16060 [Sphingomonas sp. AR_OL41]|uniref:hypothetical protein n=1 Tax=Sphingomonas sp. AR_OL41 TaxID=3042729 RepID=UPI002480083F|nr:hypothetical protein [Sphingomonas sp. AR_OL41]MDH7973707.1 hypothetical protein [Sphingomonas sp. AR_OL41]
MVSKSGFFTHSDTKRVTAAAIVDMQQRRRWSDGDAGDALGCSASTIVNRRNADDPGHQMTVHELRRSLHSDGPHIANRILRDDGFHVVPLVYGEAPDALAMAGKQSRFVAELIAAAPGGLDADEAALLLPMVVEQQADLAALEADLRATIASRPVRR